MKKLLFVICLLPIFLQAQSSGGFGFRRFETEIALNATVVSNTCASCSRRAYAHDTGFYYYWNGTIWVREQMENIYTADGDIKDGGTIVDVSGDDPIILNLDANPGEANRMLRYITDISQDDAFTYFNQFVTPNDSLYITSFDSGININYEGPTGSGTGFTISSNTTLSLTADSIIVSTLPITNTVNYITGTRNGTLTSLVGSVVGQSLTWDGVSWNPGYITNTDTILHKTVAEMQTLKEDKEFVPGKHYLITDAGQTGERGIVIMAISDSMLSIDGMRFMLCPKYYGTSDISDGNSWKGVWNINKSVSIDDLMIWGGKVWKNTTGDIGTSVDATELDNTNWILIDKDNYTNEYIEMIFGVSYNLSENWIERQWDSKWNVLGAIKSITEDYLLLTDVNYANISDWNMSNQPNGIFERNQSYGIYNNTNADITQNIITEGSIFGNSNNSYIKSNITTCDISDNSNNGNIYLNTGSGGYSRNSNNGDIESNMTQGVIENSNNGAIRFNIVRVIANNDIDGEISNNKNTGDIILNSSSDPSDIIYNYFNGEINGAILTGDATYGGGVFNRYSLSIEGSTGTINQVLTAVGDGTSIWQDNNLNGIYGGSDTIPTSVVATVTDQFEFIQSGGENGMRIRSDGMAMIGQIGGANDYYVMSGSGYTGNYIRTPASNLIQSNAGAGTIWDILAGDFRMTDSRATKRGVEYSADYLIDTFPLALAHIAAVKRLINDSLESHLGGIYEFSATIPPATEATISALDNFKFQYDGGNDAIDINDGTGSVLISDKAAEGTISAAAGSVEFNATGQVKSTSNGYVFEVGANGATVSGGTNSGLLRIYEPSGGGVNSTAIITQAQASDITLILPADDGNQGEILMTNGSGTTDWVNSITLSSNASIRVNYNGGNTGWIIDDLNNAGSLFSKDGTQYLSADNTSVLIGSNNVNMEWKDGALLLPHTNTAGGTTTTQTIDKISGTVNAAGAATSVTVNDNLVTSSSIVFAVIRTNDATATLKNVVPGTGSFVINFAVAPTSEISIGFFVINQ